MLQIEVTAKQPLALGGPPEIGFFKASQPYVPGTVVRGSYAAVWIHQHGVPQGNPRRQEFLDLFEGNPRFTPLFPPDVAPVPLTARWCKYPRTEACPTWSVDAAFEDDPSACPGCHGLIESGRGELAGPNCAEMETQTRVELKENGAADEGKLFARQMIPAGTRLIGRVFGVDRTGEQWLRSVTSLRIGGTRSIAGAATVVARDSPDTPAAAGWNDKGTVFVLDSPALLVDAFGAATMDPQWELERTLGRPVPVTRTWVRPVLVGGWHAVAGTPKPRERGICEGSVFVARDLAQNEVQRLLDRGLGLRRAEGYGCLQVVAAPWRRLPPSVPAPRQAADPLLAVRQAGLLDDPDTLRWLLSHARAAEHARALGERYEVSERLRDRIGGRLPIQAYDAAASLLDDAADVSVIAAYLEHEAHRGEGEG